MNKGAWAIIKVEGDPQPDIFNGTVGGTSHSMPMH
jgi:hypothetical protein